MAIGDEFGNYDALGLARLIRNREVSAAEVMEAAIERIESVNPSLNFVSVRCYELGRSLAAGEIPAGPFMGVPFLLKDSFMDYEGTVSTQCCRMFKDYVSTFDMGAVTSAKAAGFLLVAKTTAPECGWGSQTESPLFGDTRNPWHPDHTPGGSSGGAASAVAARVLPIASAADGAGSIRFPAGDCALVGLKVSRGRTTFLPAYPDVLYGGGVVGCVSLSVRDTAAYTDAIADYTLANQYRLPEPERPYVEEAARDPERLRIGYATESPSGLPLDADCVAAVEAAAALCESLGHDVEQTGFDYDFAAMAEIERRFVTILHGMVYDFARQEFGREPAEDEFSTFVRRSAAEADGMSGLQHALDIAAYRRLSAQMLAISEPYDIVLTPNRVISTPRVGRQNVATTPYEEYWRQIMLEDIPFTVVANWTGQPAISVPVHWNEAGVPIGIQFMGRIGDEATLLRLAGQIERERPWFERRPQICCD
ncbi:MAG: amidase [Rhodospirillales bacterium]|nr:amidase [Rhodospirillales bacterium]MDE0380602.1 amidase [Rhodospirillales bacterium]